MISTILTFVFGFFALILIIGTAPISFAIIGYYAGGIVGAVFGLVIGSIMHGMK